MGMASPSTPRNTQRNRPDRQVLSRLDTGALVREARRIAGLSQSELAARVGHHSVRGLRLGARP